MLKAVRRGWNRAAPIDRLLEEIAAFEFSGVSGFSAHQSLAPGPFFKMHDRLRSDIECLVEFMVSAPPEFVEACQPYADT